MANNALAVAQRTPPRVQELLPVAPTRDDPVRVSTKPTELPEWLLNRLLAHRAELMKQGGIFERKPPRRPGHHRLRYRVSVHRVDILGCPERLRILQTVELNPEEARAVQCILDSWRSLAGREEWRREEHKRWELEQQRAVMASRIRDADEAHELALKEELMTRRRRAAAERRRHAATEYPSRQADKPARRPAPPRWPPIRPYTFDCIHREKPRIPRELWREMLGDPEAFVRVPANERFEQLARQAVEGAAKLETISASRLPHELKEQICALREVLRRNGCVIARREEGRRRSFRLRFRRPDERHGRVHASISIPDAYVDDVRSLLLAWRAPAIAARWQRVEDAARRKRARRQLLLLIRVIRLNDDLLRDSLLLWLMYLRARHGLPMSEWPEGVDRPAFLDEQGRAGHMKAGLPHSEAW